MGANNSTNKQIDLDKLSKLPADVLYELAQALAGNSINIQDKINNVRDIGSMCQLNKRFNQLYCQNDRLWKELWLKDISSKLPKGDPKKEYIQALDNLNIYSESTGLIQSIKNKYRQDYPKRQIVFLAIISMVINYDLFFNNLLNLTDTTDRDEILIEAAGGGRLQALKEIVTRGVSKKGLLGALDQAIYHLNTNTVKYIVENLKVKLQSSHVQLAIAARDNDLADYLQANM